MEQFKGTYRNRYIEYTINDNNYSILIDNNIIECDINTTPFKGIDIKTACHMHIDDICYKLEIEEEKRIMINEGLNKPTTQEEIQAEILLNQAEILANQNAQDEVLAEMLLNSLEV